VGKRLVVCLYVVVLTFLSSALAFAGVEEAAMPADFFWRTSLSAAATVASVAVLVIGVYIALRGDRLSKSSKS